MRGELTVAALLGLGLFGLGALGCGDPAASAHRAPLLEDARVLGLDGGTISPPMPGTLSEGLEPPADRLQLEVPLRCEWRMDPLLCDGHCPPNQGCCISGVRPRGICHPFGVCDEQCLLDCLSLLYRGGSMRDVEQCESMCTWVAPTTDCVPTR